MRGAYRVVLILALVALTGGIAGAQEQPVAPEPPAPFPAGEIPAAAERLTTLLRDIDAVLVSPARIESVREALPVAIAHIDTDLRTLEEEIRRHSSARSLTDLQLQWRWHGSDIAGLQNVIGSRFQQLQRRFDDLQRQERRWQATTEALRSDEAASALLERARRAISDIETMRGALNRSIADVLTLQSRAADAQARVSLVLERLDRRAVEVRSQRWSADAAPLWAAFGAAVQPFSELSTEYADAAEQIRRFAGRSTFTLLLQSLLFIGLAAVFLLVRKKLMGDDDDARSARATLSRPISLALLLALLLGSSLHQQSPMPVVDLLFLISIPPLLRVAGPLVPQHLRAPLIEVCLLFGAHLLLTPVDAGGPVARLIVVAIAVLAIGMFVRGIRRRPTRRVIRGWLRTASIVLAFAIAALFFGWTALGTLLVDATLRSGFLGLSTIVASASLGALIPLLPRGNVVRWIRHLEEHGEVVVRRLTAVINAFLATVWAWVTLLSFDLWDPLVGGIRSLMAVEFSVGAISLTVGGLFEVVFIIVATLLLSRYVRFLLDEEVLTRLNMDLGTRSAVSSLLHYAFVFLGGLLAASAAGLNTTQLTVVAGALGVGIGFGLQAIVSNFVSGLILIFERPISVGDRVQVGPHLGVVQKIGIRASVVRSYEGSEIIIPNSELVSQQVLNWTFSDETRRVDVPVGVAYGTDTGRVMEILQRVAENNALVLEIPRPEVLFTGFGDSSLNFVVRCWVRVVDTLNAASALGLGVERELRQAGVTIPFPQRDVHLYRDAATAAVEKEDDPEAAADD